VLDIHPESVSAARRLIRRMCEDAGVDADTSDLAVLLTSETVTNAIVHGRSDVRLSAGVDAERICVGAGDDNSRHPVLQTQDCDALDGRGIAMLEASADRWGVADTEYGKVVWFELRRARHGRPEAGRGAAGRAGAPVPAGGPPPMGSQTSRRSVAQRVSWWRVDSCSLRSTADTWLSTVLAAMDSSTPTSLYV
jgi:anti-sigma regulatory factor (Ser/Thr protein kinase)